MPTKEGGGNQQQSYDAETGKYTSGSSGLQKNEDYVLPNNIKKVGKGWYEYTKKNGEKVYSFNILTPDEYDMAYTKEQILKFDENQKKQIEYFKSDKAFENEKKILDYVSDDNHSLIEKIKYIRSFNSENNYYKSDFGMYLTIKNEELGVKFYIEKNSDGLFISAGYGKYKLTNFDEVKQQILDGYKEHEEYIENYPITNYEKEKLTKMKNAEVKKQVAKMNETQKREFYKDKENRDIVFADLDEPLYEDFDPKKVKGGYNGYSTSNRAQLAYDYGQMPLSKWTKQEIEDVMFDVDELEPYIDEIEKYSLKELKDNLLEKASWHHTSKMYNKTDFYGVVSPKQIVEFLESSKK